jgi:hypothetical protein
MSATTSAQTDRRVLAITHTPEDGTTLEGTTREDDLYRWLRSQGWNYRRSVGDFRLQGSPNKPAKRHAINRTAEGLRERGFDVHIAIDDTVRSFADAEADRAANAEVRAERLEARSTRLSTAADNREHAGRRVLDGIPLGQPYLVDHPGYAADRNRRERAFANLEKAAELGNLAERVAEQAKTASNHMAYRHHPETVVNRINQFEAEQRGIAREVARGDAIDQLYSGADEARRQQLREQQGVVPFTAEHRHQLAVRAEWLAEQLRGWRAVREQQIADGEATNYTKDTFAKGDFVQRRGDWYPVLKVNTVSVTVPSPSGGWTATVRFEHITDHVRPGDERWETAKAKAIATGTRHVGNSGPHASIKALMDQR